MLALLFNSKLSTWGNLQIEHCTVVQNINMYVFERESDTGSLGICSLLRRLALQWSKCSSSLEFVIPCTVVNWYLMKLQFKPVNHDSFKGDFLLIDMLFWEHFLYRGVDPFWTLGGMIGWRVSANCGLARTGGCLRGDVAPSEAGRFLNFENWMAQFGEYFWATFWLIPNRSIHCRSSHLYQNSMLLLTLKCLHRMILFFRGK